MSAQVITIRPLARPKFDNRRIGDSGLWQLDNAQALARYWTECGHALGLSDPTGPDEEEFNLWLREMWTQTKRLACLPHLGCDL